MDLEGIPGMSEELNSEFHSMNEEFTGHDDEQSDAFESSDTSNTVDLDKSVEDQAEEAIIHNFF